MRLSGSGGAADPAKTAELADITINEYENQVLLEAANNNNNILLIKVTKRPILIFLFSKIISRFKSQEHL